MIAFAKVKIYAIQFYKAKRNEKIEPILWVDFIPTGLGIRDTK